MGWQGALVTLGATTEACRCGQQQKENEAARKRVKTKR